MAEKRLAWGIDASGFHYAKPQMESCDRVSLLSLAGRHNGPEGTQGVTLPRNVIRLLGVGPFLIRDIDLANTSRHQPVNERGNERCKMTSGLHPRSSFLHVDIYVCEKDNVRQTSGFSGQRFLFFHFSFIYPLFFSPGELVHFQLVFFYYQPSLLQTS